MLVYFSGARKPRVVERYAVIDPVERERRILIYRRSTPLFGTVQPAAVLKDAERFGHILHHFAEGIFKPQWATCAFSISSMVSSPYTDQQGNSKLIYPHIYPLETARRHKILVLL